MRTTTTTITTLLFLLLAACDPADMACGAPDGGLADAGSAATTTVCTATVLHTQPREVPVSPEHPDGWEDAVLETVAYEAPANVTSEHFSPGGLELAGCRVMIEAQPRFGAFADDNVGAVVDPADPDCAELEIERSFLVDGLTTSAARGAPGEPAVYETIRYYGLVDKEGGPVEGSYLITGLSCAEVAQ